MEPLGIHPLAYFSDWFVQPLVAEDASVKGVMDCLNRHPLATDESACDYVMRERRYYERPGRFRLFGETQDTFYCFVAAGQERRVDPPVYLETCLDLQVDYNCRFDDIIDGDHILVCDRFTDFLWHMLGQHVCLRTEGSAILAPTVNGILGQVKSQLEPEFTNPLGKPFCAGHTLYFSEDVVCSPSWGTAFANHQARDRFLRQHQWIPSTKLAKPSWA
ncbi:MAG: hypothetical protein JWN70_782 [Planctomycetaceae bacterium]|nr:hypothetical protein [Planctomycetaceae bacterium]